MTESVDSAFITLVAKIINEGVKGHFDRSQCDTLEAFLLERVPHYAKHLNYTSLEILEAMEEMRHITAPNFYQENTFPRLDANAVYILRDLAHYKQIVGVKGFRCPACGEISLTNPYECHEVKDGKQCNWKAYGLFGTMGKGLRVLLRDQFLTDPSVAEIFMPVALEHLFENGRLKAGEKFPE
ncbi:TPA: hypothetical protein JD836_14945 [Citrobacter freundii]|nr:hypothetical protein [Citrobacter freundii]HCD1268099.1 hypothetical protein [Citrobacter freundii]